MCGGQFPGLTAEKTGVSAVIFVQWPQLLGSQGDSDLEIDDGFCFISEKLKSNFRWRDLL